MALPFKQFLAVAFVACLVAAESGFMIRGASAYSDNCSGSALCSSVSQNDCITAYNRFDSGTTYSAYTSRVSGHCTAIFRCQGSYPATTGADLKNQFNQIYNGGGCGKCGSHAFDGGNCEATLNYCASCKDSG